MLRYAKINWQSQKKNKKTLKNAKQVSSRYASMVILVFWQQVFLTYISNYCSKLLFIMRYLLMNTMFKYVVYYLYPVLILLSSPRHLMYTHKAEILTFQFKTFNSKHEAAKNFSPIQQHQATKLVSD